jgi:hypothetical protein
MAGGRRIGVAELASMIGSAANRSLRVYPLPDTVLRRIGELTDVVGRFLPLDTAVSAAAMQYFTQMPESDDTPSTAELGVNYRDPRETLRDAGSGLQEAGRLQVNGQTWPRGRQALDTGFQYCPSPQFGGNGANGGLQTFPTGSHQSPF